MEPESLLLAQPTNGMILSLIKSPALIFHASNRNCGKSGRGFCCFFGRAAPVAICVHVWTAFSADRFFRAAAVWKTAGNPSPTKTLKPRISPLKDGRLIPTSQALHSRYGRTGKTGLPNRREISPSRPFQ
jgi:hypothetical protein